MSTLVVRPLARPPDATVTVPGSKSITNRALLLAALAAGRSRLDGALESDDTAAMVDSLRRLGIGVEVSDGALHVTGTGGQVPPGPVELDARQSGTTARFLAPFVALGQGRYRIDGHAQLRARPMGPLVEALRALGATVDEKGAPGHLPLTIAGGALTGGTVRLPGDVSSQFLSGLLMAGPAMPRGLRLELTTPLVSEPYLALTVAVMGSFGVEATVDPGRSYAVGPGAYRRQRYRIEPDASAASYFFAAAAITGGRVRIEGLGSGSIQGDVRFADVLEAMGARVVRTPGTIEVRGPAGALQGVDVDMRDISDTAPTLAAVAPFAAGPTRISGIGFIRRKESDRIAAVVRELTRCGIEAREEPDGLVVQPGTPRAARIETYQDHRLAMSFALLGLRVPGIEIDDPDCVAKTFPGYFAALAALDAPAGG